MPLPIEMVINHLDWKLTWRRLRAGGLYGECVSTQLLALHDWLPTTQRLQKMMGNRDPQQHICRVCPGQIDNIFHSLVQCVSSRQASDLLLFWVRKLVPSANIFDIVYLQVQAKANSKEEMVITLLTVISIHNIWMARNRGGNSKIALHAEAFAANLALTKTKFHYIAKIICTIIA